MKVKEKLRPRKNRESSKKAVQLHNQTLDPVEELKNNNKSSKR
jgi:hypothetical protein